MKENYDIVFLLSSSNLRTTKKNFTLSPNSVDGGELFERVINDDFVLTERACTVFVKQICEGVEFIHSKNILHLDMKVSGG